MCHEVNIMFTCKQFLNCVILGNVIHRHPFVFKQPLRLFCIQSGAGIASRHRGLSLSEIVVEIDLD